MEKSFPIEITSERVPEGSLNSGKDSQGEGGSSQTDWRKVPACGAAVRSTGITTLGCRVWMEGGGDETRSDSEHSVPIDSDGLIKGFTLPLRFNDPERL